MQVSGPVEGVSTIPRRRRLEVLVAIAAIVVIAAVVALLVWVVPLATSGVGAEDAISKASAVKNTGIMHASMVKDMGQMRGTDSGKVAPLNAGAGSAIVHDDAGNVR